jgi:hypothetical protein
MKENIEHLKLELSKLLSDEYNPENARKKVWQFLDQKCSIGEIDDYRFHIFGDSLDQYRDKRIENIFENIKNYAMYKNTFFFQIKFNNLTDFKEIWINKNNDKND